jgi:hypothetical protein
MSQKQSKESPQEKDVKLVEPCKSQQEEWKLSVTGMVACSSGSPEWMLTRFILMSPPEAKFIVDDFRDKDKTYGNLLEIAMNQAMKQRWISVEKSTSRVNVIDSLKTDPVQRLLQKFHAGEQLSKPDFENLRRRQFIVKK